MKIQKGKLYGGKHTDKVVLATKTLGDKDQSSFRGVVVHSDNLEEIGDYSDRWSVEAFSEEVVEKKTEYTKREIEFEVDTRVRFKMNELLTGLRNRSKYNWKNALNAGDQKYQHFMEAQSEMIVMFNKELEMSVPWEFDEKLERDNRRKMDDAIEKIIIRFRLRGRFHTNEIRRFLYENLKLLQK